MRKTIEQEMAKLRKEAAERRKLITKKFICKGDPEIDCLRWYITSAQRIEGYSFGQCAMSMSLDCALNPNDYMPDKIRTVALELLQFLNEGNRASN